MYQLHTSNNIAWLCLWTLYNIICAFLIAVFTNRSVIVIYYILVSIYDCLTLAQVINLTAASVIQFKSEYGGPSARI